MTQPIYPCLWFDGQAKAAAEFYCSVFENSKIINESPMVVNWEIDGRRFMGLNGGPQFKPTEGVSFVLECKDQAEIDYYWDTFTTDGGQESMCGWCKDKFGVWWQVIPAVLGQLMSDPSRSQRVVAAFMQMKKFDIEKLINA
ncbi:MAG TPA: VOC family protein [Flavobacteriales bacterium]|nr:VOC family protein [Flavobacteriales bacterium]